METRQRLHTAILDSLRSFPHVIVLAATREFGVCLSRLSERFSEQLPRGQCVVDVMDIINVNINGQYQYINFGNIFCMALIIRDKKIPARWPGFYAGFWWNYCFLAAKSSSKSLSKSCIFSFKSDKCLSFSLCGSLSYSVISSTCSGLRSFQPGPVLSSI